MTPLRTLWMAALGWLALAATPAEAETRKLCVYDPAGRSGDYFDLFEDYAVQASNWGFDVSLVPYTDEETAVKDYEASRCDAVAATGVRLQRFNRFGSTFEAIGALPDYNHVRKMIITLGTSEGAKRLLSNNGHTTVAILPLGAIYLLLRDRSIDTVEELAGKRIATMDYDPASLYMVDRVGSIIVPADLGSIGPKFNNGDVDACYVPAPAFLPFELHRGLGTSGGIIRSPIAQGTVQLMLREDRFSPSFITKSRADLLGRLDHALSIVKKAERDIPERFWIDVPPARVAGWHAMFQDVRVELRDRGSYHGTMLKVMRQLRCTQDSARSECAEARE